MTDVAVTCKYCGHASHYLFTPDNDTASFEEALKNDYEYICSQCGCSVRLNEAVDQIVLKNHGYSIEKDHSDIKKQIKEWERRTDRIVGALLDYETHKENYCSLKDLAEELGQLSDEMMAINL